MVTLLCPACGTKSADAVPSDELRMPGAGLCACGELLDAEHELAGVDRATFAGRGDGSAPPHDSGVWRFHELVLPDFPAESVVSLREGRTPLYRAPSLAERVGVADLRIKHEGMNPTGSFKDRGMTVAVSQAVAAGARTLACASTGNTSASLAAYSAAAGVRCVVLAPEAGTALGKLSQALAYGATTLLLRGDFDDGLRLVREMAAEGSVTLLNSVNPFRVEGQKTILLETLLDLGWEAPDWFVFPAGNLGNCSAFGKALREALALGLIDRAPRLAAVQATGASPFSRSFEDDFEELVPMRAKTVATAIQIGAPVSFHRAVRAIRGTNGVVTDVDDEAILAAKAAVDGAGIGAEPASCASVAGAMRLVREGVIGPGERVVCLLTGHLLKDPGATLAYHESGRAGANPPRVIDADRGSIEAALGA